MRKKQYLILASLLTIFLTFISLRESDDMPKNILPYLDKIFHFLAYIFLMILWSGFLKLQKPNIRTFKVLTIVFGFLLVYGIIIEVLQSKLTTTRLFEINDVFANLLGILTGGLIFEYIFKFKLNNK